MTGVPTPAAKRLIPTRLKPAARRLYYLPADSLDRVLGRRGTMVPPRGKIFVGQGDFELVGRHLFRHLTELAELRPDDQVLDIGCGIGRIAVPLTGYLKGGTYEGLDTVADGINWCQREISSRYPHFRFTIADVYNKYYNPRGTQEASRYRFPYASETFDCAIATSLFTHMLPAEVANYLTEIERVLKPGGKGLITFYLLNSESRTRIESGLSGLRFPYGEGVCRSEHKGVPETAIAYDEDHVRGLCTRAGLEILEPVHHGSWSSGKKTPSYQDLLIVRKPFRSFP